MTLHLAQHLDAVHLGHLQVQQDDDGLALGSVGELAAPMQVVEGLGTVADGDDLVGQVVLGQGVERQFYVAGTVVRQQDSFQWGIHGGLSFQLTGSVGDDGFKVK